MPCLPGAPSHARAPEVQVLTAEEFAIAGDYLVRACPTWSWCAHLAACMDMRSIDLRRPPTWQGPQGLRCHALSHVQGRRRPQEGMGRPASGQAVPGDTKWCVGCSRGSLLTAVQCGVAQQVSCPLLYTQCPASAEPRTWSGTTLRANSTWAAMRTDGRPHTRTRPRRQVAGGALRGTPAGSSSRPGFPGRCAALPTPTNHTRTQPPLLSAWVATWGAHGGGVIAGRQPGGSCAQHGRSGRRRGRGRRACSRRRRRR